MSKKSQKIICKNGICLPADEWDKKTKMTNFKMNSDGCDDLGGTWKGEDCEF